VHTHFPKRLHRQQPNRDFELSTKVFKDLGHAYIFQSTMKCLWSHLATMNRVERVPPSLEMANGYGMHACYLAMLGWQKRSARYGARGLALAGQFNNLLVRGETYSHFGIGDYASSRYEPGIEHLTKAITAFEQTGDFWELHLAHFHKGCCHFGLGDLAPAVAEARWVFESSARIGDSRPMCSSWLWARATQGNLPFDQLRGCFPCRPDDVMSTVHGIMAEGLWHSFHSRTQESLEAFARAADMVRKSLCINSHTILVLPMLAGALRRRADAIAVNDPRQARVLRGRALRAAKWAARLTRIFPAAYPLALRELSLALAARGKLRKALRAAEKSCHAAELQKAKYELMQSRLVSAQLMQKLALPSADEQCLAAQAALDEIEKTARVER